VQMELQEVLDLSAMTVSGKTLGENLKQLEDEGFFRRGEAYLTNYNLRREDVIRSPEDSRVADFLLERESSDEKIKSSLAKKRKEGVRDEDIQWWFNMDDLERRILLKLDDVTRHALFTKLREEDGLSEGEAAKGVRKSYPVFGDPDDTTVATGEDRPLPYELKDRIRSFVKKRMQRDPEAFKKEIKGSSSFNALIRREVKEGNI
jgi:Dihydroxyacid dehydratase/phosphogluconate dehydratase